MFLLISRKVTNKKILPCKETRRSILLIDEKPKIEITHGEKLSARANERRTNRSHKVVSKYLQRKTTNRKFLRASSIEKILNTQQ